MCRRPASWADPGKSYPGPAWARPGRRSRDVRRRRVGGGGSHGRGSIPSLTSAASGPPTRRCAPGSPPPSTATSRSADENDSLRRQLARALGDQRSARTRSG